MPEGERSELTEIALAIADAMMEDFDALIEAWGQIPFMHEEITREEYMRRWRAMTPKQRSAEMQRMREQQGVQP